MAITDKSLTGSICGSSMSGVITASAGLSGSLNISGAVAAGSYENLSNKPKINGVELVSDRSFEDLGFSELSALDVFNIFNEIWKG